MHFEALGSGQTEKQLHAGHGWSERKSVAVQNDALLGMILMGYQNVRTLNFDIPRTTLQPRRGNELSGRSQIRHRLHGREPIEVRLAIFCKGRCSSIVFSKPEPTGSRVRKLYCGLQLDMPESCDTNQRVDMFILDILPSLYSCILADIKLLEST